MTVRIVALALLLANLPVCAADMLLYATTIRVHVEQPGAPVECALYQVNSGTGASTRLASIRLDGKDPIAVVSLAIHPSTRKIFGVTAGLVTRPSLVTIDAASGNATLIGATGEAISDLAFSSDGTLYGWLLARNRLARINLYNAQVAPLEDSGITSLMGGAMAIDKRDLAHVAATGATGTLDTVDIHSGHATTGPKLQGAPYLSAITNLTFSPNDELFGINSNMGSPARSSLVKIHVGSGSVTEVGPLPNDSHALIFAPAIPDLLHRSSLWEALSIGITSLVVVTFGIRRYRRDRPQ